MVESIPFHWPCNCSVLTFSGQMVQISWELLKLQPPAINCSHQYTVPAVRASHCPLNAWMDTCSSGKCVSTQLWPCTNHTLTGTQKCSWRLRSVSGVSYSGFMNVYIWYPCIILHLWMKEIIERLFNRQLFFIQSWIITYSSKTSCDMKELKMARGQCKL